MQALTVGQPWPGPRLPADVVWMPESGVIALSANGAPLSASEREGLTETLSIAVLAFENLVGFALSIPGWPSWQESLIALPPDGVPESLSGELTPHSRQALSLVVVENGIVAHLRMFTLSPHATRVLHQEVQRRWKPLTDEVFTRQYRAYVHAYPTSTMAVRKVTVARCRAGD